MRRLDVSHINGEIRDQISNLHTGTIPVKHAPHCESVTETVNARVFVTLIVADSNGSRKGNECPPCRIVVEKTTLLGWKKGIGESVIVETLSFSRIEPEFIGGCRVQRYKS